MTDRKCKFCGLEGDVVFLLHHDCPACPDDSDDPDTCEFGRYDEAGNAIEECQRTDYQEVQMYDGDTVRICAKHRSWPAGVVDDD